MPTMDAGKSRSAGIVCAVLVTLALVPASFTAETPGGRSCLWAVAGDRNTVYLLGSLHLATPGLYPLDGDIERAYGDSTLVVLEADIESLNAPGHQARIVSSGLYLDGTTLRDHLRPGAYELFAEKAGAFGLPPLQLERFKPWLAAITITAGALRRMGYDPQFGIDRHFHYRARRDGKELAFLETAEAQLAILTGLEGRLGADFMEQSMRDLDQLEEIFGELVDLWKNGAAEEVGRLIRKSFEDYPVLYDHFVVQRNRRWLKDIEGFLAGDENVLVVVGTGHLTGDDGIVRSLARKGYPVNQM